jgi:carbon-monoxide dehydrogenase large subunit
LLAGNLADYLIPTATDFPKIRAIALENHRSPSNPLGVKGAGEGAIIPIGGLMANAVANALTSFGAMPNQLPLSPARVWHMGSAKRIHRKCEMTVDRVGNPHAPKLSYGASR